MRNCLALNGRPISKTSTSTYPVEDLNPATGEAELRWALELVRIPRPCVLNEDTDGTRLQPEAGALQPELRFGLHLLEDEDGTTFNCNPSPDILDAVPLSSVTECSTRMRNGRGGWHGCVRRLRNRRPFVLAVARAIRTPTVMVVLWSAPLSERLVHHYHRELASVTGEVLTCGELHCTTCSSP